jgi:hypothetical protein
VLVQEQLAFALNRRAGKDPASLDRQRAIRVLEAVEQQQGPSAETCGLLGRVHKDLWDFTRAADPLVAKGHLRRAVAAYRRGFEVDWRDAYPGINAVTLLDVQGDAASLAERDRLLPVVRFAVERRLVGRAPDYWDHATMLELAVVGGERSRALEHLEAAVASIREPWEAGTTARNLVLLREARAARGEDVAWIDGLVAELSRRSG